MNYKIVLTKDGSNTLFCAKFNEHYHSLHGAITESYHVYINTGFKNVEKEDISILEIGFGTGLNAFLTCITNDDKKKIFYTAVDPNKLEYKLVKKLRYFNNKYQESLFFKMHNYEISKNVMITRNFNFEKISSKIEKINFKNKFDLIYYDAFSPNKHPEIWSFNILSKLYNVLMKNGIIVTYCAKGSIKRLMNEIGFKVDVLNGPPGKREIIRATKL